MSSFPIGRVVALALSVISAASQAQEQTVRADGGSAPRRRVVVAATWDTLWSTARSSTLPELRFPVAVVASGSHAYVADAATGRIRQFDLSSGRSLADLGDSLTKRQIHAMQAGGEGELITFIRGSSQIRRIRVVGGAETGTTLAGDERRSVCTTDDGSVLAVGQDLNASIYRLSSSGRFRDSMQTPWPEQRSTAAIAKQAYFRPIPGTNHCVLAQWLGGGLAIVAPGGVLARAPYVDGRAFPPAKTTFDSTFGRVQRSEELLRMTSAVIDATSDGKTIDVVYEDASAREHPWIDRYDAHTGRYVESLVLPFRPSHVSRTRTGYVAVVMDRGKFELLAIEPQSRRSARRKPLR